MSKEMMQTQMQTIHQSALDKLLSSRILLNKSYLAQLNNFEIQKLNDTHPNKINLATDVRVFRVERIVLENKQSTLESLTAAYTALGTSGYSVFLILNSDGQKTDVYLGTRGEPNRTVGKTAGDLLVETFKGHFSGSLLKPLKGKDTQDLLQTFNKSSVTAVTGVPSLSVEERDHFMQGLEKFIDAAEGRAYQALILAEPVGIAELDLIRAGYEGVATQLSPLLKQSISFGENESQSIGLTISEGLSESLGVSLGLTETKGTSDSTTNNETHGTNDSHTTGKSGKNLFGKLGTVVAGASGMIGGTLLAPATAGASLAAVGLGMSVGLSAAGAAFDTHSDSSSKGISHSLSKGVTSSISHSTTESKTNTKTDTRSFNNSQSKTGTLGSSRQITLEQTDKAIEQLLNKVDHHLERVDEARRYGGWQSAAYFIGDTQADSRSLASIFLGLMRGNNSNSEDFALTTWRNDETKQILPWLTNLTHPQLSTDFSNDLGIPYLTPATLVSGKEMAIQLSLPRRSTSTVSVVKAVAFGRRILTVDGHQETPDKTINLGQIRHLWNDLHQEVQLDINKLASHVFVTGSTGAGKSNTVYQLLHELNQNEIKFLVIEPAKGEYKHVFGHRADVSVFGTNTIQAKLLKINPFKFPHGIHVLEHIDRLIEIFNVCWPMYAAMPAVLKDAMLGAYEAAGWDLDNSTNHYGFEIFPSFVDLLMHLESVVHASAFSEEVKSNYIGSLVTRVKSLTNGLNGQIFASNEIDNTLLFDSNVIVDLSRIGSQETKSLIMGILVMRLNEYRMSSGGMNTPLKHVTVLEEAHHILKRTSTEQSGESSNVAGKAVEMLSNSIAEMRTYGEGFIIADQSPNMVDMSAIRNTNTKIVMRLPDENDRRLVGKASGVNNEQLEEIAKLPKGVAVIYQNDWLEPVLCKVAHFDTEERPYVYHAQSDSLVNRKQFNAHLAKLIFNEHLEQRNSFDLDILSNGIKEINLPINYKVSLQKYIQDIQTTGQAGYWEDRNYLMNLLVSILGIREDFLNILQQARSIQEMRELHHDLLYKHIESDRVLLNILQEQSSLLWQKFQSEKQDRIA